MKIQMYETMKNLFNKCRNINNNEIDYEEAKMLMKNNINSVLLDVRSPQEYKEGNLEGSINLPLYDIENNCENILKDKDATIIVYCQSGNRSKRAVQILKKKNYSNIYNIKGGLDSIN